MEFFVDIFSDLVNALGMGGPITPLFRALFLFLILIVAPLALVASLLYFMVGLPFWRRERARFFLDLLDLGLAHGLTAEETVRQIASCRDKTLGKPMRWLMAGGRFGEALNMFPNIVPLNIAAMLKVGDDAEILSDVIPACRNALQDELSRSRSILHALPLSFYMVLPVFALVLVLLNVYVVPKFRMVADELGGEVPALSAWVFDSPTLLVGIALLSFGILQLFLLTHCAGSRTQSVLRTMFGPAFDWLSLRVPWRRLRAHRDFATTLGTLLDAGMPEPKAVMMAGAATGNEFMTRRARRVVESLGTGESLPHALRAMDATGELEWRLANAMKGARHFAASLAGWSEAVDAKAFQQEQASAQILTVLAVLLNGLVVGLIYAATFMVLIRTLDVMVLW